ncbi:transposase [Ilumatobacter sp.]|uniref:IS110 family transposase n=1 Tax=Ilumatobacter sp. TaxID=1967498 RepID=UPI0037502B5C
MELSEIGVFVGVDMAKMDHFAQATTTNGIELFAGPVLNDQTAIEKLIDDASAHGCVAIVIDMTASNKQLLLAVATQQEVPVPFNRATDAPSSRPPRRFSQD